MGTHPIFESDFDCLTEFRCAQGNESTQSRPLGKLEGLWSTPAPTETKLARREKTQLGYGYGVFRWRQKRKEPVATASATAASSACLDQSEQVVVALEEETGEK